MNANWKEFNGDKSQWDSLIIKFSGNYRQYYIWGEYKKVGWEIYRYQYNVSNKTEYAVQFLVKRFLGLIFIYIPGGVSGAESGYCPYILDLIYSIFGNSKVYIRLDSNYSSNVNDEKSFENNGWKRTLYKLNYGKAAKHILDNEFPESKAKSKWRQIYRRSTKHNNKVIFEIPKDKDSILSISQEMQRYKKIYLRDAPDNILGMIEIFQDNIVFAYCNNNEGKMVGFRATLLFENVAFDFYTAIDEQGRKTDAGYFLLIEMMKECRKRGATEFELGGIDMINSPGVAKFKVRSGASVYKYIGEWEYTNSILLKYLANFLIYIYFKPYLSKIFSLTRKFRT